MKCEVIFLELLNQYKEKRKPRSSLSTLEKVFGPLCFQVMNIHEFFCPCHYKYKIFVKKLAYGEESNLWKIRVEEPRQDDLNVIL